MTSWRPAILYLAKRAGLSLVQLLNLKRMNLSTCKCALAETERQTPKYGLLLPEELVTDGD